MSESEPSVDNEHEEGEEPISKQGISLFAQLVLLAVAVIWGWTFVLIKESLYHLGTFSFLFYRFLLAIAFLLVLFRRRMWPTEHRTWLRGALVGSMLFFGYWLQTWGLNYTTAGNSAFITGLFVVFVPILEKVIFGTRVSPLIWLGSSLSVLGLCFMIFGGGATLSVSTIGDLLTLLCALGFALHILLVGKFSNQENYLSLLFVQLLVVVFCSGAGMMAIGDLSFPQTLVGWRGVLITGVLATAFAYWAQNKFQPLSTPTRTSIIFSGEPVFASLFGFIVLGEVFRGWQWFGAVCMLSAILLANVYRGDDG